MQNIVGLLTDEKFYLLDEHETGVSYLLDEFESLHFIDSILDGTIVRKTVSGTQNLINVFFKKGSDKPIAFSRLMPCGYNYFLRTIWKAGVTDVRRTDEALRNDCARGTVSQGSWIIPECPS